MRAHLVLQRRVLTRDCITRRIINGNLAYSRRGYADAAGPVRLRQAMPRIAEHAERNVAHRRRTIATEIGRAVLGVVADPQWRQRCRRFRDRFWRRQVRAGFRRNCLRCGRLCRCGRQIRQPDFRLLRILRARLILERDVALRVGTFVYVGCSDLPSHDEQQDSETAEGARSHGCQCNVLNISGSNASTATTSLRAASASCSKPVFFFRNHARLAAQVVEHIAGRAAEFAGTHRIAQFRFDGNRAHGLVQRGFQRAQADFGRRRHEDVLGRD